MTSNSWLVLTATLPTTPSGLRVRVWRGLKATGAGTLRDGVYVLPADAPSAPALWALERTIAESGAPAHMLVVQARDEAQEASFRALFDRSDAYAELLRALADTRRSLARSTEAELRKQLRALDRRLQAIVATDFFPGRHRDEATQELAALRRNIELRFSPDEPTAGSTSLADHSIADYQRRTWATRSRPGIDRLATAWLIRRFIDSGPTFVWLSDPRSCPSEAVGYDFDGATFSHIDGKVTFEVVAASFGLLVDQALQRMGAVVHELDVGGMPTDEAPGVELLIRGLRARHVDDDELLVATLPLFDALYAGWQETP